MVHKFNKIFYVSIYKIEKNNDISYNSDRNK